MKLFNNIKFILLAMLVMAILPMNAFASTDSCVEECYSDQHGRVQFITLDEDGNEVEADYFDVEEALINLEEGKSRSVVDSCCEPNSPKTRLRQYMHSLYTSIRCDYTITDYDRCNYCGTRFTIAVVGPIRHVPGSGSISNYCPY